jgi:alkylation response protein AidB-like acyl-CoA dehydrogenase
MTTSTLDRVRELAAEIAKRGDEIEAARRVPLDLLDDLIAAGCFRMLLPQRYGGSELSPREAFEVIEELSRADASTGWTVMIGGTTPPVLSYLPEPTYAAIYADGPDVIGGGTLAPKGRLVAVDGGYRVTGQWPFASGCQHCSWLAVHGMVVRDGAPVMGPNGTPQMRLAAFPADQVEIVDTWHVAGLKGTGSHDVKLDDAFCPDERTAQLFGGSPSVDCRLSRVPLLGILGNAIAAVAVGIAGAALDDIAGLAGGGKRPAFTPNRRLAESPVFQARLGEADATLRAARALLYSEVDAAWERACAGDTFELLDRGRLRAGAARVTSLAVQVVDFAYTAAAGSAVYESSPLQRRLRDIHTLTQHAGVSTDFFTVTGALLAGEEVDASRI